MAIAPVRGLGKYGIITDISPYNLPTEAFSSGNNIRFAEGAVKRAPIFRIVDSTITPPTPAHITAFYGPDGNDTLFYARDNGSLYKYLGGTETDVTPAGFVTGTNAFPFTSCVLAGVVYINRMSHEPYKFIPGTDSQFATLTGWDANHRCRALRKFNDYLIALNITKSGVEHPNMVKWSDTNVAYGAVPPSWDHTDPTKNAGENYLADADSPILDGLALRNSFIIYTENQCWIMEHIGGREIFSFRKLYGDAATGILNTNCVVEVDGRHYVFGREDIYVHDGLSKRSLASDKIRTSIYKYLKAANSSRFFVTHDPRRQEVLFCFQSAESNIKWPNVERGNRAWAYNYVNDTWAPRDLPNTSSAVYAKVNQVETWTSVAGTWADVGGVWAGQADGKDRHLVFIGAADSASGLSSSKILVLDNATNNALLNYTLDAESTVDAYVERIGLDLDELGIQLSGYKVASALYPQARVFNVDTILRYRVGGSLFGQEGVEYADEQLLLPDTEYKVDFTEGGRYLAIKLEVFGSVDFEWSGYDANIHVLGKR